MAIKNMVSNAVQYASQAETIAVAHRRNKDYSNSAEFLSGLHPDDKLYPVITLTILWNADEWTAPKDLHSMLDADDETLKFIDNYHVHLITPADISEDNFTKFHSELNLALRYIKYSKDKEQLISMLKNDNAFTSVSRKTANLINTVTNSKLREKLPTSLKSLLIP